VCVQQQNADFFHYSIPKDKDLVSQLDTSFHN